MFLFIINLPKNEDVKEKWFVNIGRKVNKYSAVCSKHFEEKDFRYKVVGDTIKRFLIPEAVPTVLLPSSNRENILNNNIKATSNAKQTFLSSKTSDEISVLHSHQLQSNRDNSNAILANVTNTNIQDGLYFCVEVAESENVTSTVHVETKDNMKQFSAITEHEFHSEITHDQCKEPNMPMDFECSNNVKQTTALKRKSNEPTEVHKHFCNPRYIGDLRREDFTSETSWKIVQGYLKTSKSQAKVLNQKIKRVSKKVETFKSLLVHLKKNDLLSNEVCNALEISLI